MYSKIEYEYESIGLLNLKVVHAQVALLHTQFDSQFE